MTEALCNNSATQTPVHSAGSDEERFTTEARRHGEKTGTKKMLIEELLLAGLASPCLCASVVKYLAGNGGRGGREVRLVSLW